MFDREQTKSAIMKLKLERAQLENHAIYQSFRPSRQLPINVIRDGSRWICQFETDPDPMKCVVAYGDSPEMATRNFDALWNGQVLTDQTDIQEDNDDEEEQF